MVDLANHAAAAGHEVTVVAGQKVDEALLRNELSDAVRVDYIVEAGGRGGRYLAALPWLWRHHRWLARTDIVHCHMTFAAVLGSIIHLAKRRRRRPVVVETYHAVGMPIPTLLRWLHSRLATRRDALVLMAEDAFWKRFVGRHREILTATIPNGVAFTAKRDIPAEERIAYRRKVGIPDGARLVVGTIGRLEPARQPWLYPPIFAEIARQLGPDVHFIIGGEGRERARTEAAIAEQGLEGRVHLPGLVRDVSLAFSAMDLYVTMNVGAVTGVAALEAAAFGLPVLAVQLLDDYQGGDGDWIWSSRDPGSVSSRAVGLLRDPAARLALVQTQQAYANTHHSVEGMARAYDSLYQAALVRTEAGRIPTDPSDTN